MGEAQISQRTVHAWGLALRNIKLLIASMHCFAPMYSANAERLEIDLARAEQECARLREEIRQHQQNG